MSIYVPYTYHLYHKPTQTHYYGSRYAQGCHPNDLWTKYFSSSKLIKQLREQYGDDSFTVKIRRTFDTAQKALEWEQNVLRRLKVLRRDDWLNANINGSVFALTQEGREARSRCATERWQTEGVRQAHASTIAESWIDADARRSLLVETNKLRWSDPAFAAKMRAASKERWADPAYRSAYEGRGGSSVVDATGRMFASRRACANFHDRTTSWVRTRIAKGEFTCPQ